MKRCMDLSVIEKSPDDVGKSSPERYYREGWEETE
jgi:hypothetical protein